MPSVTLVALWLASSAQLYTQWQTQKDRNAASNAAARPIMAAFFDLQEERRLSGAELADPEGYRKALRAQRVRTDADVTTVQELPDSGWSAPDDIRANVVQVGRNLRKLADYRAGVDQRTASQQQTFDHYTSLISGQLNLFTTLSHVGLPNIDYLARPAIDSVWAMEMISRENAVFTRGSVTGRLSATERGQLAGWIGSQHFLYDNKIVPLVPDDQGTLYRKLMAGGAWKQKATAEQNVLSGTDADTFPKKLGTTWSDSVGPVTAQLQQLNTAYSVTLTAATEKELNAMVRRLVVTSVMGAVAVLVVVLISALLTRTLRRRISALRVAALDLQTRMPAVVERLRGGDVVDLDAELPTIQHGDDELGQLGQALNLARHSALDTTMAQVSQFRGFEKLLQRIARRTQLLIGLQMKKLSELERRHEDPEVLEGLFDLDHLTARLRRYEENLVILGGGQPQRRWRKPVLLLDVLRSAQSEVQDYRRIQIDVEDRVWLAERAVGLVIHVLAELMENAVGFSRPPTPVEVYAARVGRGLAVEIEDRGVGMDPEQYDEANRLMTEPPRMDAMSRADDVRLGLYVVARLARALDIQVELRPSSFGGTRVVVLIPDELVVEAPEQSGPTSAAVDAGWPPPPFAAVSDAPGTEHRTAQDVDTLVTGRVGLPETSAPASDVWTRPPRPLPVPQAAGVPRGSGTLRVDAAPDVRPLPKRVRLASLADELRDPAAGLGVPASDEQAPNRRSAPARSGATIGAFQRQSRMVRRDVPPTDHEPLDVLPHRRRTPTED
ncbi:nitrate- and nitrite sensing domain-containing protein [Streptomyces pseudovenezuelae]|uniref:sensor histidine kinase n=1 Tax=Streptomyces pseudovenezuelae TaxID=67350 RepID=UPI002E30871C|nr:nitrate- and nitrite sensing domain-containing protein [Streptomyces pseudovenezuelae]